MYERLGLISIQIAQVILDRTEGCCQRAGESAGNHFLYRADQEENGKVPMSGMGPGHRHFGSQQTSQPFSCWFRIAYDWRGVRLFSVFPVHAHVGRVPVAMTDRVRFGRAVARGLKMSSPEGKITCQRIWPVRLRC